MPDFYNNDEGSVIQFFVSGELRYGILMFIKQAPCLIDEDGDLWKFDGGNLFKVGKGLR